MMEWTPLSLRGFHLEEWNKNLMPGLVNKERNDQQPRGSEDLPRWMEGKHDGLVGEGQARRPAATRVGNDKQ
jgi:hypothetical protein